MAAVNISPGSYVRLRHNGRIARILNDRTYSISDLWDDESIRRVEYWGPDPMRFINSKMTTVLPHVGHGEQRAGARWYPLDLMEDAEAPEGGFKNPDGFLYFPYDEDGNKTW